MKLSIADLFCGAGGTSTGAIEAAEALGYAVDLTAVNHWEVAIATHQQNHPEARHLCTGIDTLRPAEMFGLGGLDLLWASPECTHHSTARGGRPIDDQSRATAWCVIRWAEACMPPTILVENVPEFLTWGPCGTNGRPMKSRKGAIFHAWKAALEALGYRVEWRILCAADYGDPTTRRRLFVQAVRGRRRIVWPDPTHRPQSAVGDQFATACQPWVPARAIIDWSLHGESIFERKRPLAPKTLARIDAGLRKFGLSPFIAAWDHQSGTGVWSQDAPLSTVTTKARHGVVEPFLVPNFGERKGQLPRVHSVNQPVPTVTSHGAGALVQPFLVQVAHGEKSAGETPRARSVDEPLPTVCGNRGEHALIEPHLLPQQSDGRLRPVSEPVPTVAAAGAIALVEPFLVKFYATATGAQSVDEPIDTVTCKDRHALVRPSVTIQGERYLLDIRFRMLQPHELAAAQGFRRDYQFSGNKTEQVRQIGNAVPRRLARALVAAALSQKTDVSWLGKCDHQEVAA